MKADTSNLKDSKRNMDSYRRVNGFCRQITVLLPNGSAPVIARFYYPGNVVYCVVWIHGNASYGYGMGRAGGYGYHKESAALADALRDAGVTLDLYIDGRGDNVMREAVEAVARAVTGKRKFIVSEAYA